MKEQHQKQQHQETCSCGHDHHEHSNHHDSSGHCHCSQCELHQENTTSSDNKTNGHGDACCTSCSNDDDSGGEDEPPHKHGDHHCCSPDDHCHDDGCGCGHDHEHGEELEKSVLIRIAIGAAVFVAALLMRDLRSLLGIVLFVTSYLLIGGDVVLRALNNILKGQIFDENFLMSIATVGAFFIGEYPEAVAVMLFYQVGEIFQSYAVGRSRRSITELMDIRPDSANLLQSDGSIKTVSPQEIQIGDTILIQAGEKVPLDSIVLKGESFLNTSALTGESLPREISEGSQLLSGCINQTGVITARVTKRYSESTVSKILELTENASSKKAQAQKFITRFAKIYTPIVVGVAVLLAIVPPLVIEGAQFNDWVYRGLAFLVTSCPCALVISIPLSFFGGIGGASRCGILIKGGNYLEMLSKADIVAFDKTGTLTMGKFAVTDILPQDDMTPAELLEIAAYAESYSTHPIALSVVAAYEGAIDKSTVLNYKEFSGKGISALIGGRAVLAGNRSLLFENNVRFSDEKPKGTEILVAVDGKYVGKLVIADLIKKDTPKAIEDLKKLGIRKTVMLTGDSTETARVIADKTGVDEYHAQLLPADKVDEVEKLQELKAEGKTLAFVGDGINDAPVLARADVGIAMGGLGSDAAIEAADIVLMTDELSCLPIAIEISRKTMSIVRQNVILSLAIKLVIMVLVAIGMADMWFAVFADVGVSLLAILNAMRALNTEKYKR